VRLLTVLLVLALCGCTAQAKGDGRLTVLASVYPFAWAAQQVGGPDVHVVDLVRAGAEPHDVELSPRQIGAFEQADLVVYLKGFQPAVDDAIQEAPQHRRFDVSKVAEVEKRGGGIDPHVWLDPIRMAAIVREIADRLVARDPDNTTAYRERAGRTTDALMTLHAQLAGDLQNCPRRDIVTAHTAFAYLAERYRLNQIGVTGLNPDGEPSPGRVAEVARYARAHGVTTVFFESLADPKLARTVADEIGAKAAVLDPVEGVKAGDDYLTVMRRNAAALHTGLGCP
jgi:zinc transport system substrate-binding protein